MVSLEDGSTKWQWYDLHKSLGFLFVILLLARIFWRSTHHYPKFSSHSAVLESLASITHLMLYLVMIILPISGYLDSAAGGYHFGFFGLFDIPAVVEKNAQLASLALSAHVAAGWLLVGLVVMHASAALFHQFVWRDGTLYRMLPLVFLQKK